MGSPGWHSLCPPHDELLQLCPRDPVRSPGDPGRGKDGGLQGSRARSLDGAPGTGGGAGLGSRKPELPSVPVHAVWPWEVTDPLRPSASSQWNGDHRCLPSEGRPGSPTLPVFCLEVAAPAPALPLLPAASRGPSSRPPRLSGPQPSAPSSSRPPSSQHPPPCDPPGRTDITSNRKVPVWIVDSTSGCKRELLWIPRDAGKHSETWRHCVAPPPWSPREPPRPSPPVKPRLLGCQG